MEYGYIDFVVLLAALAVVATCDSIPSYNPPAPTYGRAAPAPSGPAQYDFNWEVKDEYSGNDFGHQESRDGYDTQGAYYVLQPDGRLRRVDYTVNGDSGFVAQVNYEGEARYSEPTYTTPRPAHTTPRPAYTTPQPTYA
ncbi:cuticle protein 8-like [Oratosquilla oratoria]|uniref:cuticle protein 8-like n=1 Tax=Oratosquilla oratoria TaxID=337810 RepID=UPI003F75DE3B